MGRSRTAAGQDRLERGAFLPTEIGTLPPSGTRGNRARMAHPSVRASQQCSGGREVSGTVAFPGGVSPPAR